MENKRIQLFTYCNDYFNIHHSISENYEDPYTKLHMHTIHELYLFIDGDVEFNIAGNKYMLEPGMVMLMRPGEAHSLNILSEHKYERISIHFDKSYFENNYGVCRILDLLSDKSRHSLCVFELNKSDSIVEKLFHEITDTSHSNNKDKLTAVTTNLPALLYHLYAEATKKVPVSGKAVDTLVQQIINYIDNNLYTNWTLDDIADALYRDKAYLNRKFKQVIGTGIWDYTIRKRIIGLKQKMHSFSSVNEAYKSSGFTDYSTFFRNYVKITGNPPSYDLHRQARP